MMGYYSTKIKLRSADLIIEAIGWAILLSLWVFTIHNYSAAEDLFLPVLLVFIFVALSILQFFPNKLNYPAKITNTNAPVQYALAIRLLSQIKLAISASFSIIIISVNTIHVIWVEILSCLLPIIPLVFFIHRSYKIK